MSDSALRLRNHGAYSSPFSGVGIEFFPLGVPPGYSGFVLHEAGYLARNDWWDFPNVLSPFWRLYYNFRRGHRVLFADREVELTPEHMVIIPDRQLFHCRGAQPVPNLWLAFSVARRLTPQQAIPILLRPTRVEHVLMRAFVSLFAAENEIADHERILHCGMALLHMVLSRPEIAWQHGVPAAIQQTVRYIEEHYAAPLAIPKLARMVHLGPEALSRSFKKCQGETLGRFIAKVRVREAAHLLAQSNARIEDIAERTGFPNRAYLSRVFKKVTGEAPAEFRRRHGI